MEFLSIKFVNNYDLRCIKSQFHILLNLVSCVVTNACTACYKYSPCFHPLFKYKMIKLPWKMVKPEQIYWINIWIISTSERRRGFTSHFTSYLLETSDLLPKHQISWQSHVSRCIVGVWSVVLQILLCKLHCLT